jgi:hypothetical protein
MLEVSRWMEDPEGTSAQRSWMLRLPAMLDQHKQKAGRSSTKVDKSLNTKRTLSRRRLSIQPRAGQPQVHQGSPFRDSQSTTNRQSKPVFYHQLLHTRKLKTFTSVTTRLSTLSSPAKHRRLGGARLLQIFPLLVLRTRRRIGCFENLDRRARAGTGYLRQQPRSGAIYGPCLLPSPLRSGESCRVSQPLLFLLPLTRKHWWVPASSSGTKVVTASSTPGALIINRTLSSIRRVQCRVQPLFLRHPPH